MHAFDFTRNQYNSSVLLVHILEQFKNYEGKIVGITGVDLFVPVLTYVVGEAQLDGKAVVVSAFRLDDALYGYPSNPELFIERLTKETVHEVGHTFGLLHCADYRCVMHSSTSGEEIDVKGNSFCAKCETAVKNGCNNNF
jgi:archaemetzincin